jgi:tetratricopeptide (TPR) repeat protein
VIYKYVFVKLGCCMKKAFLLLVIVFSIIFQLKEIHASSKQNDFFSREGFVNDVKEGLLEDHEALTAKMAPYLKKLRERGIPNCFECSLHLIKSTLNSDSNTQLVASDLAAKFSPDLPEAHIHYFMRLIKFSPFSIAKMSKSLSDTFITFFMFPPRDAFFYSVLNRISIGCIIFLAAFLVIMLFKHWASLVHRYMHLVGFSRFYAFALLFAVIISSLILSTNELSWLVVLMTVVMFFSGVGVMREKIIMHFVLVVCVLTEGAIILTGVTGNAVVDKNSAMINLKSIYSPTSISLDDPEIEFSGGSFAKGAMFYYSENFNRAAFYFKRELKSVTDKKIKASVDNFLGLSLARQGNYEEAREHLKSAYESTENFKIGYNLSRILYESGKAQEATVLEKHILENGGAITLSFPYIYYPEMYRMWRYLTSGKTGEALELWVQFFLYILFVIFSYIVLLMVRMNYLKGIKLHRCLECGSVICSSCNPGSNAYVCVVCRLMKAKAELFKKGESTIYEKKREGYFNRYSLFTMLFTFFLPGGGLIFSDKVVEGSIYLSIIVFFVTYLFFGASGVIYYIDPGSTGATTLILGIIAGIAYLFSVVRGFFASRSL